MKPVAQMTEFEAEYIKQNARKLTIEQMATGLDRGIRFIKQARKKLNISRYISEEDKAFIKANYAKMSRDDIAKAIGRTRYCIEEQKVALGIPNKTKEEILLIRKCNFTSEEDQYILENNNTSTMKEIAYVLGRPVGSIRTRRRQLGLNETRHEIREKRQAGEQPHFFESRPWTEDEVNILTNNLGMPISKLSKIFNRSKTSVKCKIMKLGVKRPKVKSINQWTKAEDQFIIANWHLKTPQEISKTIKYYPFQLIERAYYLGLVKSIEKRQRAQRWTLEEDTYLCKNYYKDGASSIAIKLNRTANAVHRRCHVLRDQSGCNELRPLENYIDDTIGWNQEDDTYLRKNYAGLSMRAISIKLGRHPAIIRKRIKELGVTRNKADIEKINLSESSLPDSFVAHLLSNDHKEKELLIKYPALIRAKRAQILLTRVVKHTSKK